jgi:hypothetical protein
MQFLELQFKRSSNITKTQKRVYCIRQYTELPMALFQDLLEKNEIGGPLTPRIISISQYFIFYRHPPAGIISMYTNFTLISTKISLFNF